MLVIIAAIGKNRELGRDGRLCFDLPDDLRFFKEMTMGHKVLMGRKTYESLPNKGLPGRELLMVTRERNYILRDKLPAKIISDLTAFIKENKDTEEEIFVIGGGVMYWQLIKYAKKLYLTEVDDICPDADVLFPEFNKKMYDKTVLKEGQDHGIKYTHVLYTIK